MSGPMGMGGMGASMGMSGPMQVRAWVRVR